MTSQRPFASRSLSLAVLILLSAFCLVPSAFSQSTTATLSGTVSDQNGAIVPGATVTALNTATTLERHATTNDEGGFTIPLLPPGTYSVTTRRDGFAPVEFKNVVLNVGDRKALKIELKAGDVNATVQVLNEAPLINESPAVATTIDRQFVGNLPLNGRSFQSLILLSPGVTVTTVNQDYGQFSVNGQRASTNYFTVDGVSANIGISPILGSGTNMALAGADPGLTASGGTNSLVSVDALEEFKIQTSTYSAEFGRQPGGQISLVTRSGGNQFHGTLFEYLRNEALDARNYFNQKPASKTPLRQNQFGGTFSGPVKILGLSNTRRHTFFFFSYEGQRLRLPINGVVNVPSVRLRQVAAPALQPVLNAFPVPTGPELLDAAGQPRGRSPYNFAVSNPSTMDATSIRIDQNIGRKVNLFGRFNDSPSDGITSHFRKTIRSVNTRTLTVGATSAFSARLSNELRFNYSGSQAKQEQTVVPLGGAAPIDPKVLTSGYPGLGFLLIPGTFLQVGPFSDNRQRQLNIVDNLLMLRGAHSIKIGMDYRRLSPTYGAQDQQSMFFFSEAAVKNGIINLLQITTFQPARPRFQNVSAYLQDTWKKSQRLTLDLGLRWELNPPPTEADGRIPPLAIGIVGNDVSKATLAPPGAPFYKTFYTAFAPRVGVAYKLNQKSGRETILRGGFGVYYDLGSG